MSEGLKELKQIELKWQYGVFTFIPNFEIIEQELKEAETYKEILNDYGLTLANFREACLLLAQWKSAGLCWADYERQKEALNIIKEKQVNVSALLELDTLEEYNDYCDMVSGCKHLTQEEYDLLKEVLG